jgi:gliding motility-associated-like protein
VGSTTAPVPSTQGDGQYFVTQKDANGCESRTRAELDVQVTPKPKVTVNPAVIEQETTDPAATSVEITLSGTASGVADGTTTVEWTQGSTVVGITETVPGIFAPATIHPLDTTRYYFTATPVENITCSATASVLVKIIQSMVIPTIFSPNGDGVNDFWDIGNIQAYDEASVSIFNRYGQFVYKSGDGYRTPWDGKYHGEPLPVGTYFYIIRKTPDSKPMSGNISIVR